MRHKLICPVIIGREAHLETMERILVQAKKGHGGMLFVAGEAGWGKTRLAAEFKTRATDQGWIHFQGNCFDTERSLPYAPIIELLRSPNLEQIPDELTPFLSQVGYPTTADKYQLYFTLANYMRGLSAQQPILFIVEDLHWCDDSSLVLLLYLVRRLSSHPTLFLGTFRSNEIRPGLAHFLSQLERERLSFEILLTPLSRNETGQMVQSIFKQTNPARVEFIDLLYPFTEGNPFYIEETLKSMLMAGDIVVSDDGIWVEGSFSDLHIPRSVQDAVQQRSEQLSPTARKALILAAVVGRRFDFNLLQILTRQDEITLLELFKELLAAQLIVEENADQFVFRHALTREAIYQTLLSRERRQMHRLIAETLEGLPGDNSQRAGDLAYHFSRCEDWGKTFFYACQAGERALDLDAPRFAIEHFGHAIEAASKLSEPTVVGPYLQRGRALTAINSFEPAQNDLQNALKLAREKHYTQLEWETLLALGNLWVSRDYAPAGKYFQQAQSLAREIGDPKQIATSLNVVGNWQMNQGHPFEALNNHHEALAIAKSLGYNTGIAQALDYLGIASLHCGQIPQGRAYFKQVLPMWDSLKFPRGSLDAYCSLAFVADYDLEVDDQPVGIAVEWGNKSLQLSRQNGWRPAESLALISTGLALRQQGASARALAVLHQGLEISEEIEHTKFIAAAHGALGEVYLDILSFSKARQHLETALDIARQTHSAVRIFRTIAYLVLAYIHHNEYELAKTLLDGVLETDSPMQGILLRMLWGSRIELALVQNDGSTAFRWLDRMIAMTENLATDSTVSGGEPFSTDKRIVPRLWHLRGQALITLDRFPEAEQDLQTAIKAATQQDRRGRIWRIHRTLAYVLIAQNQLSAAEMVLDSARQGIEEIAAGLRESYPDLAEQFTYAALASLPALPSLSIQQSLKRQFGGLTAREREIAATVAQGKTNRDIADEFVLSERTVERHIANIMKKLSFNTRAQIAVWAVEKGLDYTPKR